MEDVKAEHEVFLFFCLLLDFVFVELLSVCLHLRSSKRASVVKKKQQKVERGGGWGHERSGGADRRNNAQGMKCTKESVAVCECVGSVSLLDAGPRVRVELLLGAHQGQSGTRVRRRHQPWHAAGERSLDAAGESSLVVEVEVV